MSALALVPAAEAQNITQYRFDATNNRFEFTTATPVTPKGELVFNPSRIVIDLPGIRVKRPRKEARSGPVREIRFGQVTPQTARIVLELAPGYSPEASQIKIRGITQRRWVVEMPDRATAGTPPANSDAAAPTPEAAGS